MGYDEAIILVYKNLDHLVAVVDDLVRVRIDKFIPSIFTCKISDLNINVPSSY